MAVMFPVHSTIYIVAPNSTKGQFMKKPFVKFISQCASYMVFLMLLTLASQRAVHMVFEILGYMGYQWMQEVVDDWKRRERGSFFGPLECLIVCWVMGQIWVEV